MASSAEAHIINLPKICDPRGNMSVIENQKEIPFNIARAYWIYDVPGGMYRNGHAFRTQQEFIVALSGSFDVVLNDGESERRYHMARSYYGLWVPPMTWRKIDNFSTNSVVLVLSDTAYDPADYIEDFDEFSRLRHSMATFSKPATATRPHTTTLTDAFATSSVNQCQLIDLGKHHHANGNLTVVQAGAQVDFDVKRIFYLYDIPGGENRGGHAHRELSQLIVAMSGAFDLSLTDGHRTSCITLNRPYQALLVPPGIWNTLQNFSSGAVCAVLCSDAYDEADYVRNFSEFEALTQNKSVKQ